MMKPEILLLVPIYAPVLAQLEQEFTVHKLWQASDPERFMQRRSPADVRVVVTTGLLGFRADAHGARCRSSSSSPASAGRADTIDLERRRKRGIPVTNTPDRIADAVGELAAGMAVALMRRICESDRFVRRGAWPQTAPTAGNTLVGKTCGIVGLGRIGRETATRLEAFGMSVRYHGPRRKDGRRLSLSSPTSKPRGGIRLPRRHLSARRPRRGVSSMRACSTRSVPKGFS